MNPFSFLSVAAAAIALVLSIWLFVAGSSVQGLQSKLQENQLELQNHQQTLSTQQQKVQMQNQQIQQGKNLAEQVGPAVLKDMASLSVSKKNEKIRGLLAKYGVTIQEQATPAPGSTPSPSTPTPRP